MNPVTSQKMDELREQYRTAKGDDWIPPFREMKEEFKRVNGREPADDQDWSMVLYGPGGCPKCAEKSGR